MYLNPAGSESIRQRNREQFSKLRRLGICQQLWSRICGVGNRLIALSEIEPRISISSRYDAGIRLVALSQIRGSHGRSHDFDGNFRPLKNHSSERWASIATARETFTSLPVIQLVKIGEIYFVVDGHHRISVARRLGQKEIDASVTVWETVDPVELIVEAMQGKNHVRRATNRLRHIIQRIQGSWPTQGFQPKSPGYAI